MLKLGKMKKKMSSDLLELLNHGKNYVSADLFAKGLGFISIPIFTRLLTPDDYGILSIFTSITAMLIVIYGLGIRGSVTRYYYEKGIDFKGFFGANILFVNLWGLFLMLLLFLFRDNITKYLNLPDNLFVLCLLVAFFSVSFEIYQSYLQASKQSKKYSILNILKTSSVLLLSVIIILLLKEKKYLGQIFAELIVFLVISIYAIVSILKISKLNFNKKYIKYSLLFGVPIVFHLLSQTVLASFDQIIINQLNGANEAGLYSFAYQIGLIQSIISMAILKAWTPIFYDKMNQSKFHDIEALAENYSKLIYGLAVVLMLFSYEIVFVMADSSFYTAQDIIPVIIISYVFFFLYTLYVSYSFYHKKTYLIAIFTVISGLTNIMLNYIFIPKYGYKVAAWTTLVSFFTLFILHYMNTKVFLKNNKSINLLKLLPNLLFITMIFIGFFFIQKEVDNYLLLLLIKMIILTVVILVFSKKIKILRYG